MPHNIVHFDILLDDLEIVGVGRMIRFQDSEGNIACAMHYVER